MTWCSIDAEMLIASIGKKVLLPDKMTDDLFLMLLKKCHAGHFCFYYYCFSPAYVFLVLLRYHG